MKSTTYTLAEKYFNERKQNEFGVDIREHLDTLRKYADKSRSITEFGVQHIVSTWPFILGRPEKLVSVDIYPPSYFLHDNEKLLNEVKDISKELSIDFNFILGNTLEIEIERTDLLFIDTVHTYEQLSQELTKHANKVNRWIILHDTESCKEFQLDSCGILVGGLQKAIDEFLEKNMGWYVKEIFTNNNGLTVLEKRNSDPNITNKLFILSRYKEDFSWIKNYTDNYIIYNKGESIDDPHVINTENIGGNQRDIFRFIYDNYESLPELIIFIQAYPFDHCKKEVFDKLILHNHFTSLEYYGFTPANDFERRTADGGFLEINNSWYILNNNVIQDISCIYESFDVFMDKYFKNYKHLDFIRFAPGSQYLIEKKQILFYPKNFWKCLLDELPRNFMTEGHIIERALWTIFQCTLELK